VFENYPLLPTEDTSNSPQFPSNTQLLINCYTPRSVLPDLQFESSRHRMHGIVLSSAQGQLYLTFSYNSKLYIQIEVSGLWYPVTLW